MRKSKIMILLISIIFILTLSAVSAADTNETSDTAVQTVEDTSIDVLASDEEDVLSDSPGTFSDLQSLIDSSSGELNLSDDYCYDDYDKSASSYDNDTYFKSGIKIDKTITINGNGHSIDANSEVRIFSISASNVVLNNITFKNGYHNINSGSSSYGGAIDWSGDNGVLQYCNFENNTVDKYGGAIWWDGNNATLKYSTFADNSQTKTSGGSDYCGGAIIFNCNMNVTVDNCIFTNNTAGLSGGAIYLDEVVNFNAVNCQFENNTAGRSGGALYLDEVSNFNAVNCQFKNNTAQSTNGGAIYWNAENSTLNLCNFTGNTANSYGGAIYSYSDFTAVDCQFVNNKAINSYSGHGGAICLYGDNATLENSNFTNNTAYAGGAVYWNSAEGSIDSCIFKNNNASGDGGSGGSLYIAWGDSVSIENSQFSSNTDFENMDIRNLGTLYLKNNTIDNETAKIANYGTITSAVYAIVLDNKTIDVNNTDTYVLTGVLSDDNGNLIFDNSFKFIFGGEELAYSSTDNTVYTYNSINVSAVGVYVITANTSRESNLTVKSGIIRNIYGTFTDLKNIIDAYVAGDDHLVLTYNFTYNEDIDSEFVNGIPINNIALIDGNVVIDGNNQARLFNVNNHTELYDVILANGFADYGGAVYVNGGVTFIANNVEFINNTAEIGGAVYSMGTLGINYCDFINNSDDLATVYISVGSINNEMVNNTFDSDRFVYNGGNLRMAENTELSAKVTNSYSVYNTGYLTLKDNTRSNNKFNTTIWNAKGGKILSNVNAEVLNNQTVNTTGTYGLTATIVDDDGNSIYDKNVYFTSNGEKIETSYSDATGLYSATLNMANPGIYTISLSNITAGTVKTATVRNIYGTFSELQKLINENTNLILDHDFAYLDVIDDGYFPDGIIINNQTVINANASTVTGNGTGTVFVVDSGNAVSISNITIADADLGILNKGYLNVLNSTFEDSVEYAINNTYVLYLSANNVSTLIYNQNDIYSKVIATLIDGNNITSDVFTTVYPYATLTDDSGNIILDPNFKIKIGGDLDTSFEDGLYTAVFDIVTAGDHTVTTSYTSNNLTIVTGMYTVSKINITAFNITFNVDENNRIPYGENLTATVNLEGIDGAKLNTTVDLIVDSKKYTVNITNGTGSINLGILNPGKYSHLAVFTGDGVYNRVYVTGLFTVLDTTSDLIITVTIPENTTVAILTVNLASDAEGYVLIDVAGENYYAIVSDGEAIINLGKLTPGTYTANVTFTGDLKYDSVSNSTEFTVPSNVNESAFTVPEYSETTTPTYSISLPSDASGYFEVDVDGTKYVVPVVNGSASITPTISEGTHNVTATYSGDDKYASISQSVNVTIHIPVYKITGNKAISVVYSATATYKVLITKDGKAVGANESVTVNYNGKNTVLKTDANGYITFKPTTKLAVKSYTIKTTYKGVTATSKVTVKQLIKAKNKKVKKSKTIKVKVKTKKVNGKFLKGKKLKLKIKGKTVKAKINKKGKATFKLKKKVTKKLKKGKKYKYTVSYGKDKITKKLKIKK